MGKKLVFFSVLVLVCVTAVLAMASAGNNGGSKEDEVLAIKTAVPTATATSTFTPTVTSTATVTPTATPKPTAVKTKKPTAKATPPDEVSRLIARIRDAQKNRAGMKANLVMTTKYAGTGQVNEVTGSVAIRKPDKFRVKYVKPQEQVFVSNGKTLWVYTPALNQVIKQDIKKANLDTHFYIEFETSIDYYAKQSKNVLSETDTQYVITMKPKSEETGYEEITAKVDKKTLTLVSMTMKYEGMEVEVKFTDITGFTIDEVGKQAELKNAAFEFKVPEGAEEIEASNMIEGLGQ